MSVPDSKRSGRSFLIVATLALTLLTGGCASTIDSRFTVYHAWPADAAQRSFRFLPPPQRAASLEQAAHQALARPELQRAGFTESPQGRFGVTLLFTESQEVRRVLEPAMVSPWFGWGGWSGGWSGWGIGAVIPFGWPPVRDEAWFQRTLDLKIDDLSVNPPRRVYEVTAVSEDLGADPAKVLPVMLRQVLQDFPGQVGVRRSASTPVP